MPSPPIRIVKFKASTRGAIDQLSLEDVIDKNTKSLPYGKPFQLYFLVRTHSEVDNVVNYKLELLWKHSRLTEEVGRFGEILVGKIVEDLLYDEVETRKKRHAKEAWKLSNFQLEVIKVLSGALKKGSEACTGKRGHD